jgi:hypothetical protein
MTCPMDQRTESCKGWRSKFRARVQRLRAPRSTMQRCVTSACLTGNPFVSAHPLQRICVPLQTQTDIADLITEISDTVRELEEEQQAALAQMEQVEAGAGSAAADQSLPPIQEVCIYPELPSCMAMSLSDIHQTDGLGAPLTLEM